MESYTDSIRTVLPAGTGAGGKSSFDNRITEAEADSARSRAVNDSLNALEWADNLQASCAEIDKEGKKCMESLLNDYELSGTHWINSEFVNENVSNSYV